jgi:hypothetical protein
MLNEKAHKKLGLLKQIYHLTHFLFFKQDSGSAHSLFGNVPVIVLSLGFL